MVGQVFFAPGPREAWPPAHIEISESLAIMARDAVRTGAGETIQLSEALAGLEKVSDSFGASDLTLRAQEAQEPLDRGEIWVVVVGQFKRGKSTVLNALLESPVLPTGMAPVTSVVTQIRWGPTPGVRITLQDETPVDATLDRLQDFVSEEGNPGNHRGVRRVEVSLPSPLLDGGLVLVDTPGIGSLDPGATDRAYAFLPRVDAALVVLSPDPPLGEAEGSYLRTLLEHTPHLLFVLNKVDLFPEAAWREAVEFNRRSLGQLQGVAAEEVDLIPVSATRALNGDSGGITELRTRLQDLVKGKGEAVSRDAARRRLQAIAGEMLARLSVEERAIHLTDANLEERLGGLGDLRRELALRREEIQPVLLDATRRLVEGATTSLRTRAEAVGESIAHALQARVRQEGAVGNGAMVRIVSEALQSSVVEVFEGWWAEHEQEVRAKLREAMTRAARSVDATGSTLTDWVERELGVALPTPPPPLELVDSHDFYYHVQGLKPALTVDLLWLLLPRPIFRRWILRKIPRMVRDDLELNVGRIRGDLLYRAQETVRAFFSELNRGALEAEDGVQTALLRALEARAGAKEEGAGELERLSQAREQVQELLDMAGDAVSPAVPAREEDTTEDLPEQEE